VTSNWLPGIPLKAAPADLRARNHKNLTSMGVSPEVVDLFLANTVYTPVQQTKLVNALATPGSPIKPGGGLRTRLTGEHLAADDREVDGQTPVGHGLSPVSSTRRPAACRT
jgi:hypothetical protein